MVMLQDDGEKRTSTQGEGASDMAGDNNGDDDDDDDQTTVAEDDDDADKVKGKTATSRQNVKLYAAEGILNTKMKRAEKKRRKKASKSNQADAMDDDYDFKVDYKKGSAMDVSDESGED